MTDKDKPRSYEKFNYLLRPSKQVERKLFVETLHHLRAAGYPIYDYTYLGLGSIFYADFVLFHKYLYIDKMICAERDEIATRMRFNKPFPFVRLVMNPIASLVPSLRRNVKYIVWLDYDRPLDPEMLGDLDGFTQVLAPGSIVLLTVEAEPRLTVEGFEDWERQKRDTELFEYFRSEFGSLVLKGIRKSDLSKNDLPRLLAEIVRSQLSKSLLSRLGLQFHQLFNFVYADGAQMLTLGGLLDQEGAKKKMRDAGIFDLEHVRDGVVPERITVPPLTAREKGWIDSTLLSKKMPKRTFGLENKMLRNYQKFYKYYPMYHEAVI